MKSDRIYLLHIRDAVSRIEEYAKVGRETFMSEPIRQDATIRQLEIIGEASKKLSLELREAHSGIPWRRICGLRDVLIHDYMGVDLDAVWAIVEDGIPPLKQVVLRILREE